MSIHPPWRSTESRKRSGSPSPPPYRRQREDPHRSDGLSDRKKQESFAQEQTRLNQIREEQQMRDWVSKEDEFVLKQAKKKAEIRVREGRAKIIDWLAVTLNVLEPVKDPLESDAKEAESDIVDPISVFEGMDSSHLKDLEKDIDTYLTLESTRSGRKYWKSLKIICDDKRRKLEPVGPESRAANSVLADIERLLRPKSFNDLETLESQILKKLRSDEPIDVEYWEQLLRNVNVYKAKAELQDIYKSIVGGRLVQFKQEQEKEAIIVRDKLAAILSSHGFSSQNGTRGTDPNEPMSSVNYSRELDPEPLLKLRVEDKGFDITSEEVFLDKVAKERDRVLRLGPIPPRHTHQERSTVSNTQKPSETTVLTATRFANPRNEDFSTATTALYEREVARGVQEDEEIFTGEEEVSSVSKPQWASKYRPRKPRYFNRVQMGYEWNKYNQTHYDHDNPPPKVVQGYKFNVFYPDLIDKVKAPTYRIEREHGRKRGESFAPAGEEDTCLIRFMSGPPYEDLAFRIIDKEWDYSAKRERGFRSSFDKGILQLHFQFKKVYYRK